MSLRVNLFDATDGTVIGGDAVRPTDAETARQDFRETVLAYFGTDADGGQIRCLFAAGEDGGDARPVLAQARWEHDGYAGVDKPPWANFTQFVTGEVQAADWAFVDDKLTESVFRKLNNRTIDPTEAGDSQLDRPLGDDTAHIRAPSTPTAVAVFNHFARQEYDVPFSVAVCESVPAHLRDSLTVLVTTDDGLAKPVVERFEDATGGTSGETAEPDTDGAAGGDGPASEPDPAGDHGATADATAGESGDSAPASGSPPDSPTATDTGDAADDGPPAVGGSRRATDADSGVPRGSPRADELPDHEERGTGGDGGDAGEVDPSDGDGGEVDPSDGDGGEIDHGDDEVTDLADEEFPLLDDEEADAFLSGESAAESVREGSGDADEQTADSARQAADAETGDGFGAGTETDPTESEFDTTVDFDSGDFDDDFGTEFGGDGFGDDEFGGEATGDGTETGGDRLVDDETAVDDSVTTTADDSATASADDSATASADDSVTTTDGEDHDPVAEFVAETETRPSSDAIPESVREESPSEDPVSDAAEPEQIETGSVGSTAPDFDEIDPDGSAVETVTGAAESTPEATEPITGVAPDAAYELRLYSGPTGRLQYSTERESARVDQQAKWDYDNGLSLSVVPSEGVVRAYFNASRNGPEQFLAEFQCGEVASDQLLETFVETLEATLAEQGWELLDEAGGRQLVYSHVLTATPFDPDLSGADLGDLLAEGTVDFVVPTHAKAVELFRWVQGVSDPETAITVCGAGRTERTASADVVIQKDASAGGVTVTGAAQRRLDEQTLERAVRETTEAFETVVEAVYREGGRAAVDTDEASATAEPDAHLDTVIVDILNEQVPSEQSLSFVADGSRARRYELAVGWGVVGYAVAVVVSTLTAVAVGAFDDALAGLGTAVPLTGTLLGGSDPPGWVPTLPLGVVLIAGVAALGVSIARPAAAHPLTRGLLGRVRSWWRYPPVAESSLFDGSQIRLLAATGEEDTIERRLERLRAAHDAALEESAGFRSFLSETVLSEPPLDSLAVAPRTETRRRRLSTVGGGVAVGVVLGLQTTATVYAVLSAAAAAPALTGTITFLAVVAVGLIAAGRWAANERDVSLSELLDEFR